MSDSNYNRLQTAPSLINAIEKEFFLEQEWLPDNFISWLFQLINLSVALMTICFGIVFGIGILPVLGVIMIGIEIFVFCWWRAKRYLQFNFETNTINYVTKYPLSCDSRENRVGKLGNLLTFCGCRQEVIKYAGSTPNRTGNVQLLFEDQLPFLLHHSMFRNVSSETLCTNIEAFWKEAITTGKVPANSGVWKEYDEKDVLNKTQMDVVQRMAAVQPRVAGVSDAPAGPPPAYQEFKLPPGWRVARTDDGNIFYINDVEKTTQWNPPV